MRIREAYDATLQRNGHVRDAAQERIVDKLDLLQDELDEQLLQQESSRGNLLQRLLNKKGATTNPVQGLYIWGGVGRGKTFLMDLFFDTLQHPQKKRIHFHRMMQDVHLRLGQLRDTTDPLEQVAADIAAETKVLCFDEFFVSDIGDAMILGRLLQGLFDRGVTLVTTSNVRPDELYRDGLQRQRFLPAIELLNHHTQVVEIDSGTDYRLQLLRRAGTWLTPNNASAIQKLNAIFDQTAQSEIRESHNLQINGRAIRAHRCAKSVAWFEFIEVCDGPRSQADYIELSRWYPSVIISNIPQLDAYHEDQARRFIAMIDEFYDRRVKLVANAAVAVPDLYVGNKLNFEIERTTSRLLEMQSDEYLALPHLA